MRQSLGRDLIGGAANVTVNLVPAGSMFGERLNQLDMRFAKLLKAGRTRTSLNLDLYNVFNVSTVLTENATYSKCVADRLACADVDSDRRGSPRSACRVDF